MSSEQALSAQQRRLTEKAAIVLTVSTIGGCSARIFVAAATDWQWFIGLSTLAILIATYIGLRMGLSTFVAAAVLVATTFLGVAAFGYAAGGISSPVLVLLPFLPMLATILISPRAGWLTLLGAGLLIALYAGLQITGHQFPADALTGASRDVMRALFYLLCGVMICSIGGYYAKTNHKLEASLHAQASQDFLTGLANRRACEEALSREARRARRSNSWLSIIMVDLDNFRAPNDSNGKLPGDRALEAVADVLRTNLRRPADVIGRFSSEVFLVILPGTAPEHARQLAEGIRRHVADLQLQSAPTPAETLTVTLGVASRMGADIHNSHNMIELADEALSSGKQAGHNRVMVAELAPIDGDVS